MRGTRPGPDRRGRVPRTLRVPDMRGTVVASGTKVTKTDLPSRLDEKGEPVWDETDRTPRNSDVYDTTELRGISSFEDAKRLAEEKYGSIDDASEHMGTGFLVINAEAKDQLTGVPFLILSMDFNEGDMGPFVSFLAVTEDDRKYIVNDGSTGIYRQLDEWFVRTGKAGGLFVKGGLRRSDYPANDQRPAGTTYYLNV